MSTEMVSDYHGKPLNEGDQVEAWEDGARYTATVKKIEPRAPAGYRSIILIRDGDHAEVLSFSDAVVVLSGTESGGKQ